MDIRTYLTKAISDAAAGVFAGAGIADRDLVIEKPRNKSFGDLSCAVAMALAKKLRGNPAAIGAQLAAAVTWDPAFVEGPPSVTGGYINFRMSRPYLQNVLRQLVEEPGTYGRNQAAQPKRMLFEFVSANPTGPMVVVNGRSAAIGDCMARVNEWLGHSVEREYYVNDYGNQVDLFGKSVACRYHQKRGREMAIPEGGYEGEYVAELAEEIARDFPQVATLPDGEAEVLFRTQAMERTVARQREVLDAYGVSYTRWFRESLLHTGGRVRETAEDLRRRGLTYTKDGAEWFKSTDFGDEKDWVIVRSDGSPTYFLNDMAYHADKAGRGYAESHTFWGPDHHGYIPHLECGIKALNLHGTVFRNHIIQQVNLVRDGKPYKMSKRRGDFVTVSDLLDEVGVDAARYFFLMRKLSSHFDFDMNLAVKKSDDNPVFYVQYAHARQCSLLRHAVSQGLGPDDIRGADCALLREAEEIDVLKALADFPFVAAQVALWIEPQRLTAYVEEVAAAFHQFYQKQRVVTDNRDVSCARLYLVTGVKNLIATVLGLLGVSAPQSM